MPEGFLRDKKKRYTKKKSPPPPPPPHRQHPAKLAERCPLLSRLLQSRLDHWGAFCQWSVTITMTLQETRWPAHSGEPAVGGGVLGGTVGACCKDGCHSAVTPLPVPFVWVGPGADRSGVSCGVYRGMRMHSERLTRAWTSDH